MARIPGAQAHYSGSYSDLEQFLDERVIGLCTDDDVVYIKNTVGDLVPIGIKYYAGSGISITDSTDPEKPGKVISCASAVYTPNEGSPVSGALSVTQAQNGNLGVKVGNVSSDLGLLVPAVPESSTGKVLTVGANGTMTWGAITTDIQPTSIAPVFSPSITYKGGAYCMYEGVLYQANPTGHSAGDWNSAHFTEVCVSGQLAKVPFVVGHTVYRGSSGTLDAGNNAYYEVGVDSTNFSSFTINIQTSSTYEVPNVIISVQNSSEVDATVSVNYTDGSTTHSLSYSSIGSAVIPAATDCQIICLGACYIIAPIVST